MRLFYFVARKISYTFAVAFITVFGGWVGITFAFFLGTSFLITTQDYLVSLILKWLPVAAGTVTVMHYVQFGMLTPLGIPAFQASLRAINRYLYGDELDRSIGDDELKRLYVHVAELPVVNLVTTFFYIVLGPAFMVLYIYIEMKQKGTFDPDLFRVLARITGIAAVVIWILYSMSTYLLSEIITGYERATCFNELRRRGIAVEPRVLSGIRLKFGFFVILLMITLLTFAAVVEKSRFLEQASLVIILAYFLFAVVVAMLLMGINANSILRVLNEMHRVSRAIAAGTDVEFKVISVDREFSAIEQGMVEMAAEIKEYRRNLEAMVEQRTEELQGALSDLKAKDDLIQKQLDIAGTIQRGILPGKIDDWNELKFSTRYIAMEKIGGDFYDVYRLSDNKLGLLVADVSGHGIPAALLTTMAKISFGNACLKYDSPRRIFQDVNQDMLEHVKTQDYLTCFFVAVDDEYTLSYANASHQKAMLLRTGEGKVELLDTNGLFIGAVEEARDTYEEKSTRLNYGDRLLLYTDGIPEAINERREDYSMDRLERVALKNREMPLEDFTNSIIEDVQRHIGGSSIVDDITLVVMELRRDEAVEIVKSAKKLVDGSKYYEAIDFLERGLRLYPDNTKLLYNLAKNYFRVNNFGRTVESILKYVAADKRNKYAYYLGGAAYYQMMDYPNSVKFLEESLRIDQNFVNAHFALGMSRKKTGDRSEALRCFERVIDLEPDNKAALMEVAGLRKGE